MYLDWPAPILEYTVRTSIGIAAPCLMPAISRRRGVAPARHPPLFRPCSNSPLPPLPLSVATRPNGHLAAGLTLLRPQTGAPYQHCDPTFPALSPGTGSWSSYSPVPRPKVQYMASRCRTRNVNIARARIIIRSSQSSVPSSPLGSTSPCPSSHSPATILGLGLSARASL